MGGPVPAGIKNATGFMLFKAFPVYGGILVLVVIRVSSYILQSHKTRKITESHLKNEKKMWLTLACYFPKSDCLGLM